MASKIDHNHKHWNESGNTVATFIPMLMVMINFWSHSTGLVSMTTPCVGSDRAHLPSSFSVIGPAEKYSPKKVLCLKSSLHKG